MANDVLQRIRDAVRAGRVRLTDHAFDELHADNLHVLDAESALLNGVIVRTQPDEPDHPGPRYTVLGKATDLTTEIGVVCRFDISESILIITAYEIGK